MILGWWEFTSRERIAGMRGETPRGECGRLLLCGSGVAPAGRSYSRKMAATSPTIAPRTFNSTSTIVPNRPGTIV